MSTGFAVWNAENSEEASLWDAAWRRWPRREVFAHPAYVGLYAGRSTQPLCAAWSSEEGFVLYPLLLRDLRAEGFLPEGLPLTRDLTTPYGYGGPFFWDAANPTRLAELFWSAYSEWTARVSAVSEFVRFSLQGADLLPYPGETLQAAQNVCCDLRPSAEDLWSAFEHKVRKNVNKARRSGVTVQLDPEGSRLPDFLRIYNSTMRRRGAAQDYFFAEDYFRRMIAGLRRHFMFFHAFRGDRIVSTELVLCSAESIYSFLGGTEEESFDVRPNDLLKLEIILWGKSQGKSRFVLGGGYEPEDGIFRYKKAFAPNGCVPFQVGRRILLPAQYDALVDSRKLLAARNRIVWQPRPGYFPAYRA